MSGAASSPAAALGRPPARVGRLVSSALLLVAAMALVAVIVAGLNGLRVRVEQTGSMAPAIRPGDLVVVRQTPVSEIRVGDVIGVRTGAGKVIVHRVRAIDTAPATLQVTTQGDANPTSETWTIPRADEVALVRGTVRHVGSAVDALNGPVAALAVLLAGVMLAISMLRSIWSRP